MINFHMKHIKILKQPFCLQFLLHLLDALLYGQTTMFNFLKNYSNSFGCPNFMIFTVIGHLIYLQQYLLLSYESGSSQPAINQCFMGFLTHVFWAFFYLFKTFVCLNLLLSFSICIRALSVYFWALSIYPAAMECITVTWKLQENMTITNFGLCKMSRLNS